MEETVLHLPLDSVRASCGFSLDIGGSVAKIVYRSKKDFQNGEPRDKEEAKSGRGKVRLGLFARENIAEVIKFIADNCDMTPDTDGVQRVYTTGLGGNAFKDQIEGRLHVELKNLTEFDCFVTALTAMLKTTPPDELFLPISQEGIRMGKMEQNVFKNFNAACVKEGSKTFMAINESVTGEEKRTPVMAFPFVIVVCGSNIIFLKVDEDGSFSLLDSSSLGGRFFLGLSSYLTGVKEFSEIRRLINVSDGRTIDTYGSDLTDQSLKDDIYNVLDDGFRVFPFSKALTSAKDKATKGDMIHSVLDTICDNVAQLTCHVCRKAGVKRAYFCGNFTQTPKAEHFLTKSMFVQTYMMPREEIVDFDIVKNGGHLGALGAFLDRYLRPT